MLYDLSPRISPSLAVWPGDTPPSREVLLDIGRGDNLTLSTLRATVHLGSHADAPSHYDANGVSMEGIALERYLGACQVVEVAVARGDRVPAEALPPTVDAERVLLKTGTFPDPNRFVEDFAGLSTALIDTLGRRGVRLVGIDTPSVDLLDSKDLPAHRACAANDIVILEGLLLADVPGGVYELIALPLPLKGFDASPVRAVLRDLPRRSP